MKSNNGIFYKSPQLLASLPQSTSVLVAFSGGADSSALLHLLKDDATARNYKLHAAHFNHQIRGEEAERDAEFCKSTCEKLSIPFYLGCANIPALAKENGNSIETEAREKRYAFFEKIMRENNIPILVTAHHAEDQIETVMLHILRGCGISGLKGISGCRPLSNDLYLVRPLLNAKKEDILYYCAENNIEFVTDSTNADINYARNFVRAELLPKMYELQPNLQNVFMRLSESADEASDFLKESARDFIENKCKNGIPLSHFNQLHPALKSQILMLSCDSSLEYTHIQSIVALCHKAEPHSSVSLPNNIAAKIENGTLIFVNDEAESENEEFFVPFALGKTVLPSGIIINIERNPITNPSQNDVFIDVKCDIINDDAHFRSKREKDVIFAGKMNKKVKKLISEKKIPLNMRKKLPLLDCKNEIMWIPTVALCDRLKKGKIANNESFFRITIQFEN